MHRIQRFLTACVPFAAIVAVFAAALERHLGEPQRQVERFRLLAENDAPPARDYGDDARVALTRRGCAGPCKAYTVVVRGSGEIAFTGRAGVCATNPPPARVPRAEAQRLIDALAAGDFATLPTTGPLAPSAPDGQRSVVILDLDGHRHAVDDRQLPALPLVDEVERRIDLVAGTERWLAVVHAPGEAPRCPDGSPAVEADGAPAPAPAARASGASDPSVPGRRAAEPARRPDAVATFADVLAGRRPPPAPLLFPDVAWVSLARTACYGTCPVYTVRIDGAGRVEFTGHAFTCIRGRATASVPRESAQRLFAALAAIGFAALPDFTRVDATDAPAAEVAFSDGQATHRVRHYHGMRDVPAQVGAVEDAIDRVAGTARWLPADRACVDADGTRHPHSTVRP